MEKQESQPSQGAVIPDCFLDSNKRSTRNTNFPMKKGEGKSQHTYYWLDFSFALTSKPPGGAVSRHGCGLPRERRLRTVSAEEVENSRCGAAGGVFQFRDHLLGLIEIHLLGKNAKSSPCRVVRD